MKRLALCAILFAGCDVPQEPPVTPVTPVTVMTMIRVTAHGDGRVFIRGGDLRTSRTGSCVAVMDWAKPAGNMQVATFCGEFSLLNGEHKE